MMIDYKNTSQNLCHISGKPFGKVQIPLSSLEGKDKVQDLIGLNPGQPSITLTLSAYIRFPFANRN